MPDLLDRLKAALADRYAVERERSRCGAFFLSPKRGRLRLGTRQWTASRCRPTAGGSGSIRIGMAMRTFDGKRFFFTIDQQESDIWTVEVKQ